MAGDRPLRIGIARLVDPILDPFRRFIKPINGVDYTPVVAILVVNLIEWLLTRFLVRFV
jgi:YggT family protein